MRNGSALSADVPKLGPSRGTHIATHEDFSRTNLCEHAPPSTHTTHVSFRHSVVALKHHLWLPRLSFNVAARARVSFSLLCARSVAIVLVRGSSKFFFHVIGKNHASLCFPPPSRCTRTPSSHSLAPSHTPAALFVTLAEASRQQLEPFNHHQPFSVSDSTTQQPQRMPLLTFLCVSLFPLCCQHQRGQQLPSSPPSLGATLDNIAGLMCV
jgi:hypothetical protein